MESMSTNKDAVALLYMTASTSGGNVVVDSNQNKGCDPGDARTCAARSGSVLPPEVPLSVSMISSCEEDKSSGDSSENSVVFGRVPIPPSSLPMAPSSGVTGPAGLVGIVRSSSFIQPAMISIGKATSVIQSTGSAGSVSSAVNLLTGHRPQQQISKLSSPAMGHSSLDGTRFVSTKQSPASLQPSHVLLNNFPKPVDAHNIKCEPMEIQSAQGTPNSSALSDNKLVLTKPQSNVVNLPTVLSQHMANFRPTDIKPVVTWSQPTEGVNGSEVAILAKLTTNEFAHQMKKRRIVIGRDSLNSRVDMNMGKSIFISREHIEIHCAGEQFYLACLGKNGIFLDDVLYKKESREVEMPKVCLLRFPSTHITIQFQSMIGKGQKTLISPPLNRDVASLKGNLNLNLHIPDRSMVSPCLSPAGTISAANSAPASPHHVRAMPDLHNLVNSKAEGGEGGALGADGLGRLPNPADTKPPFSYAQLIVQSINSASDKQLTLSGIYSFITKQYPYYRSADKGWQNSIRHNLSLNRYFHKVPRSQEEPGKGSFWRIDPLSEMKLVAQAYRRRRQRGVSCFRTPYGPTLSTRSAPTSPSHVPGAFICELNSVNGPIAETPEASASTAPVTLVSRPTVVTTVVGVTSSSFASPSTITVRAPFTNSLSSTSTTRVISVRAIQSAPGSPQHISPPQN